MKPQYKKSYRISIPAIVNISVVATSEKQAKQLALAAVYNPDIALRGLEFGSQNHLIDPAVWITDEVGENPDKCEVLDTRELDIDPIKVSNQLEDFALLNSNAHDYYKAVNKTNKV